MSFSLPSGPLISGAAAAAAALAQGRSREELERMAAFFSLLGEMLDAFALDAPRGGAGHRSMKERICSMFSMPC